LLTAANLWKTVLLEIARRKELKESHTVLWISLSLDHGQSQLQNKRLIKKLRMSKLMVKRKLKQ
jgi:hypothetical protein